MEPFGNCPSSARTSSGLVSRVGSPAAADAGLAARFDDSPRVAVTGPSLRTAHGTPFSPPRHYRGQIHRGLVVHSGDLTGGVLDWAANRPAEGARMQTYVVLFNW